MLAPGTSEVFELEADPDCLAPPADGYLAELVVETADQVLRVPLGADPGSCPP